MGSNLMLTFKGILGNDESNYTLDDLKQVLGLTNDKSLVNFLLRLLKEEVEEANFDTMTYEEPIIEMVYNYLSAFIIEDRQCDMDSVVLRLNMIKDYVNKSLSKATTNNKKTKTVMTLFEKEFWNNIDNLNNEVLALAKVSNKYKGENGNYYLLEDMVYNIKNLFLLQEVSVKFPKLFLERNKEGELFFYEFLNFYVNIVKNQETDINDIIYYDAVIEFFLKNNELKITKKMKDLVTIAINQVDHNKKLDKNECCQRLIFLSHLKKKMMGEKKFVENKRELDNKYNCNFMLENNSLEEIKKCLSNLPCEYHDFSDKNVITVDGLATQDLDDAVSLEKLDNNNYLLGVYITDVSNYIDFNCPADIEALRLGATLYLPNNFFVPMLPKDILFNYCSLLPENTRKVIACFYEIEPDGNIKNHYFTKGIIKTRNGFRLTYEDFNNMIETGSGDPVIMGILNAFQSLTDTGMLKNLSCEEGPKSDKAEAHSIIGKFMVLTNHMAALDAKQEGVPFIYRVHQMIDHRIVIDNNPSLNQLIRNFDRKNHGEGIKNIIGSSFSKAHYSTEALPHEGLRLAAYAHTTSPLRRYADLANQRLIKLFFIDKIRDDKVIYQLQDVLKCITDNLNANQFVTNQYMNDYAHVLRR